MSTYAVSESGRKRGRGRECVRTIYMCSLYIQLVQSNLIMFDIVNFCSNVCVCDILASLLDLHCTLLCMYWYYSSIYRTKCVSCVTVSIVPLLSNIQHL